MLFICWPNEGLEVVLLFTGVWKFNRVRFGKLKILSVVKNIYQIRLSSISGSQSFKKRNLSIYLSFIIICQQQQLVRSVLSWNSTQPFQLSVMSQQRQQLIFRRNSTAFCDILISSRSNDWLVLYCSQASRSSDRGTIWRIGQTFARCHHHICRLLR